MKRAKIQNSEAIEILLDAQRARLLEPFMGQASTVAVAARKRGVSASAMNYWVRRFVEMKLLEPVAAGSGAAQYRASADEFVFDALRGTPLEDALAQQYTPTWNRMLAGLVRDFQRVSEEWLMRIYTDENGLICREGVPAWALEQNESTSWAATMPLNTWGVLRLQRSDAAALQADLEAVFERYAARATRDASLPEYLVHVGMVRAEE